MLVSLLECLKQFQQSVNKFITILLFLIIVLFSIQYIYLRIYIYMGKVICKI